MHSVPGQMIDDESNQKGELRVLGVGEEIPSSVRIKSCFGKQTVGVSVALTPSPTPDSPPKWCWMVGVFFPICEIDY